MTDIQSTHFLSPETNHQVCDLGNRLLSLPREGKYQNEPFLQPNGTHKVLYETVPSNQSMHNTNILSSLKIKSHKNIIFSVNE